MKAKAKFEFSDGSVFICNLSGVSTDNIENKCNAIANRLERFGERELKRWKVEFRTYMDGRAFIRVNANWHVSGILYQVLPKGHVIKELR